MKLGDECLGVCYAIFSILYVGKSKKQTKIKKANTLLAGIWGKGYSYITDEPVDCHKNFFESNLVTAVKT